MTQRRNYYLKNLKAFLILVRKKSRERNLLRRLLFQAQTCHREYRSDKIRAQPRFLNPRAP